MCTKAGIAKEDEIHFTNSIILVPLNTSDVYEDSTSNLIYNLSLNSGESGFDSCFGETSINSFDGSGAKRLDKD